MKYLVEWFFEHDLLKICQMVLGTGSCKIKQDQAGFKDFCFGAGFNKI